jgi:hypothetical protein
MVFDGGAILALTVRLASVGMAISSLELLVQPAILRDTGLASWKVSQLATGWLAGSRFATLFGWMLAYPQVRLLLATRLLLTGVVFWTAPDALVLGGVAAVGVGVMSSLMVLRCSYGHDGADQMLTLIFYAEGVAVLTRTTFAVEAALWFIALQACLSYFTAGVAKLQSPEWRAGSALQGILSTNIYGHPWVRQVFRRGSVLSLGGCWITVVFECLFPFALLGWPYLTIALLTVGLAFHVGNAFIMRLNTFLWAFCATYPAVWHCASQWSR